MKSQLIRTIACVGFMVIAIPPFEVKAQGSTNGNASRVKYIEYAVALVDSFPYKNASAVIVRRSREVPRDVIMIKNGEMTQQLLAASVRELRIIRAARGDRTTTDALYRVTRGRVVDGTLQTKYARIASSLAQRLQTKAPSELPGVGIVTFVLDGMTTSR